MSDLSRYIRAQERTHRNALRELYDALLFPETSEYGDQ